MDEADKKIIDALDSLYLDGIRVKSATVTYETKDGRFRFSFAEIKPKNKKGGKVK